MNATTTLRCAGREREWLDQRERWRGYIAAEEEREQEFDGPDVIEVFCSGCTESEFGRASPARPEPSGARA